jgi:hypothetical protein
MKKWYVNEITVVLAGLLLANVTWADRAEVEKKANEIKITVNIENLTADKALEEIAKLGGVTINVPTPIKVAPKVTLSVKEISVLEAVRYVAVLADLKYTVVDDGILVLGK